MNIKTKFDIGDNIFSMYDNKIIQGCIEKIYCKIVDKKDKFIITEYEINSDGIILTRHEKNIFFTKDKLLKSL